MVSAAPPFETDVDTGVFTEGLNIQHSTLIVHKPDSRINFHFHVNNISNGLQLFNDSTQCDTYIYNSSGGDIVHTIDVPNAGDDRGEWISNISNLAIGFYEWRTTCNTSSVGGIGSFDFEVTKNGFIEDEQNVHFTIIFVVIFVIIFYLILTSKFAIELFTDHAFIKLLFLLASMWMSLFPLNIALQFAEFLQIPASIPGQLELMIQIIIWINILITFYFVIWFSVEILKKLLFIKHKNKTDQDRL